MTSMNDGMNEENKCLLVWPVAVPNEVKSLFTKVFLNTSQLFDYVYEVLKDTGRFHLIIPLKCFEDSHNEIIYKLHQVAQVDILCDSANDVKWAKLSFSSKYEKVQFHTIYDLFLSFDKTNHNGEIIWSNSCVSNIKNAIISLIEDRTSAKQLAIMQRSSQIQNQLANQPLLGFPVKNKVDFAPRFICPLCELVYQQLYQTECKHKLCQVCINIQKDCSTCLQAISRDKIFKNTLLNEMVQITIGADESTHCFYCDSMQPIMNYELHLQENHHESITCFIYNLEVDERDYYHLHSNETSTENVSKSKEIRTSLNGTCIWEISDIENIRKDAMNNRQKSIYSTPFYIYPYGYKICMRLYINGDCKTKDTYMSLFYTIMGSENNDYLQWPFKCKATFTLIDHLNQDHISDSCWSNIDEKCFQCPTFDMNAGFGIREFISLNILHQGSKKYFPNDKMYIKIHFDLTGINQVLSLVNRMGDCPSD